MKDAPCAHLTQRFVQVNLLDAKAVEAFGTGLDCITIEIEGVSVPGPGSARNGRDERVVPKPAHIALIQDKGLQKQFFQMSQYCHCSVRPPDGQRRPKRLRLNFPSSRNSGGWL